MKTTIAGFFVLKFENAVSFQKAIDFLNNRHPERFNINYVDLHLHFFSDENRIEAKRLFDILGWKSENFEKA